MTDALANVILWALAGLSMVGAGVSIGYAVSTVISVRGMRNPRSRRD